MSFDQHLICSFTCSVKNFRESWARLRFFLSLLITMHEIYGGSLTEFETETTLHLIDATIEITLFVSDDFLFLISNTIA